MSSAMDGFEELRARAPRTVTVAGMEVGRGSRVVMRPRDGGDVFDRAIAGKVGVVESIQQDFDGRVHLAVTLEDDPGQELGEKRQPGHRFFFTPEEVEPIDGDVAAQRILVAGIGNIFLADDGFGVEVAKELAGRHLPRGVEVKDFGIRGMDLMYALGEGYDVAIFVDAVPKGDTPGTLFVIEPELADDGGNGEVMNAHGLDPVKVLSLARQVGDVPERVLVVGCEPAVRMTGDEEDIVGELSEPVRAAVPVAAEMVETLVKELTEGGTA
jgi:hydrogenase maturation protease